MTPEAQRIAIAEACDILEIEFINAPNGGWFGADKKGNSVVVPDYPNDLNAMHEAEKTLPPYTTSEKSDYCQYLIGVSTGYGYGPDGEIEGEHFAVFAATAEQRAEAFLRAIGKWDDSV